jgi:hypothetical protein
MKILVEEYSKTEDIRVVTDNLNIHKEKSFYETFSEDEEKQILEKVEFLTRQNIRVGSMLPK